MGEGCVKTHGNFPSVFVPDDRVVMVFNYIEVSAKHRLLSHYVRVVHYVHKYKKVSQE